MTDFPGFKRLNTVATAWLASLETQSNILKDAWGDLLGGEYDHKKWCRDNAKLYESQFNVFEAALSSGSSTQQDVPSWLTLDASMALEGNVLTRPYNRATVKLQPSDLVGFRTQELHFSINAEPVSNTSIHVTVSTAYRRGQDPIKPDKQWIKDLPADYDGPYIGLIYDGRGGTAAPLAVVTLMIG